MLLFMFHNHSEVNYADLAQCVLVVLVWSNNLVKRVVTLALKELILPVFSKSV